MSAVRDVPVALGQLGAAALRVRGPVTITRFLRSDVVAGRGVPHGSGQPVLLLPPAIAGDWLMPVLQSWVRRIGYHGHRSSIALHVDCSDRTLGRVLPRVEEVATAEDAKVTLLGHSRGGLLARALAAARPDLVERVVTLGSPLTEQFAVTNLALAAGANLARKQLQRSDPERLRMGCMTEACACSYGRFFRAQLPVPLISLFSRSDEVVRWESCLVEGARNVEVRATHVGLLAARNVYTVLAHALAGELDEPGTDWLGAPPVDPAALRVELPG
jgi:pimeloyl-ACP methyl ester carboxylesterase